jgi:DNA processing protein
VERAELSAWLRLSLVPGVGGATARKLLSAFGTPQAVFGQSDLALKQLGLGKLASNLRAEPPTLGALLQTTCDWLSGGPGRRIAALGDACYPSSLLNIEDPPLMLYMLGAQSIPAAAAIDLGATQLPSIAIVGSRNPTPQGAVNARQFAKALAERGLCVVSGLALGVDGAAHEGALAGAAPNTCATVAVVGTGLDRVYPKQHLDLAHRIAERGVMVSEFHLGTPALTGNFPKRNRLISGLSQSVLVIEAALKSGSLITARLANEQGKDVFAIPGSIHSQQSRGCHFLIKQGAKLVENAEDVLEEMNLDSPAPRIQKGDVDEEASESAADSALIAALGFDIVSLDALQARTGLPTPELQAKLLELELDGLVTRLPGGLFQRLNQA